ncbi:purine/pyrimidine permease [Paenibacillus paeoniae]|uniref:Xanthine permease n=1 Tax=Paenibacillus paeoniae TaxID=2292705 RepID=A0A371PHS4_9BACL|nr:purine/pyrimidine permease [Paenibacillus paeoniae]REK75078.1 xanthine permease [Paenibacillus paeoniae]
MRTLLDSLQWAFFLLTGGLVAPIVVAAAFGLSDADTISLLQRTLTVIGISSLLQVTLGHKLPILEGPAGVWWGVFILLAANLSPGASGTELLRQMEMGLLLGGVIILLLSVFHILRHLKKLFTPVVTGTYLLLLIFQFSSPIVKGILGIGYTDSYIHAGIAVPAIATLLLTFLCGRSKTAWLRNYSALIGIAAGYGLFLLLGHIPALPKLPDTVVLIPQLFAWGAPLFDSGIALTTLVITLPLLINMIAAIVVMEKTIGLKPEDRYRRSGIVMGINQLLSGAFSAVGCVSNSHSAGFVASTRMTRRLPFIIGCLLLIVAGLFPFLTAALASVPVPVAFAVIFCSFAHLLSAGLKELGAVLHDEKKLTIVAFSLFAGVGSMFIPAGSLAVLPDVLKPILNNGLVVGVLASILLEQAWQWKDALSSGSGFGPWRHKHPPIERSTGHAVNDQSVL